MDGVAARDRVPDTVTSMDVSHRLYVTLVHGTWNPAASWAAAESFFRTRLVSRFDGPVVFDSFDWGGANSTEARETGAALLAAQLTKSISESIHPATHVVIAHSHGGNVALRALEIMNTADSTAARRVDGLICMGTPFLRHAARRFGGLVGALFVGLLPVLSLASHLPDHVVARVARWPWVAFLLQTMNDAFERLDPPSPPEGQPEVDEPVVVIGRTQVCCVAFRGDEAGLALRLFSAVSDIPVKLLPVAVWSSIAVATVIPIWLLAEAGVFTWLWHLLPNRTGDPQDATMANKFWRFLYELLNAPPASRRGRAVGAVSVAIGIIVLIALAVLWLGATALSLLIGISAVVVLGVFRWIGYGHRAGEAFFTGVRVSDVPPVAPELVTRLSPSLVRVFYGRGARRRIAHLFRFGLIHGLAYADETLIDEYARWMRTLTPEG